MDLNLFMNKLMTELKIGTVLFAASEVEGGFMHKMMKLKTDTGTYAIKLLNPHIMKRKEAISNFEEADRLESILETNKIPTIPSLVINERKMQKLENQYFYVYQWNEGKALKEEDITPLHCQKISETLFQIHHLEIRKEAIKYKLIKINWEYYIQLANETNSSIYDLLNENKKMLNENQMNRNKAILNLPNIIAICHNDLDCKNVLWCKDTFRIIDLECLSYSNPYLELLELALCWSGFEKCKLDFNRFETFMKTYLKYDTEITMDWQTIYHSNSGRLEWLEYNVKRALMLECDTMEEQRLSIQQVRKTMKQIIYYHQIEDEILSYLK